MKYLIYMYIMYYILFKNIMLYYIYEYVMCWLNKKKIFIFIFCSDERIINKNNLILLDIFICI